MKIKKILIGRHRKGCWFSKEDKVDWVLPTAIQKDKNAKGKGSTDWIRFQCNDPDCKAELYVSTDDVLIAVEEL